MGGCYGAQKGSHHVFNHPTKSGHITVPHPKKDLGIGLVQKLLKLADIKWGNKS